MSPRVYWIGLRLVLGTVKRYIQKWDLQLQANLTSPQYECAVAVLEAVIICLNALPTNDPV